MDTSALRKQHDDIGKTSEELIKAIMSGDRGAVAALRWRLARELIAHLAVEDRWLYPMMIRDGSPKAATAALNFKREMGGLAEAFNQYMSAWHDQRIAEEWDSFRVATWKLVEVLDVRIRRENMELYPLAEVSRASKKLLSA